MNKDDALELVADQMTLAARALSEKGQKNYSAKVHCACVASGIKKLFTTEPNVEGKVVNHVVRNVYNHTSWRNRFEKAKIFLPSQAEEDDLMAELENEGA